MKQKLRKGISVLLAAVFVFSGVLLLWQLHDYRAADRLHSAARELAASSVPQSALPVVPEPTVESPSAEELDLPEEPVPMVPDPGIQPEKESLAGDVRFLMDLDLEALRQTNRRVLGWICIPDSPVDYPLLQVDSNSEYLRRAWDGTPNRAGCIFLECRNSADFSDFNTIIYGHYMRNAAMFGSLHDYGSQEYRDAHPYIYIATDERVLCYEVFAAYEADVVSDTYRLYFEDDARKQSALDFCLEKSVLETTLVPAVTDRILTLSTCTGTGTYDTRWVVQAVLIGEFDREG